MPMPFTEEQMKQVFETNIIDFASQNGFEIEKSDTKTVHVKGHSGLFLFTHGKGYYCFSTGNKGNIVDFAKEYLRLDFISAVERILNCKAYEHIEIQKSKDKQHKKEERGIMSLPEKAQNFNMAIAYLLKTRCIDKEIVYRLVNEKKIFQSKEHNNCCFVGYDKEGTAKYCSMRGTHSNSNFKMDLTNSDKSYPFTIMGESSRVFVFESPIDAMSHATLTKMNEHNWKIDSRISMGCISASALERFLSENKHIKRIVFGFDNDKDGKLIDGTPHNHGQEAAKKYCEKYRNLGYKTQIHKPVNKDFNNDLKFFTEIFEEQNLYDNDHYCL